MHWLPLPRGSEQLGSSQQCFSVPEQGAEEPFGWDTLTRPLGGMCPWRDLVLEL